MGSGSRRTGPGSESTPDHRSNQQPHQGDQAAMPALSTEPQPAPQPGMPGRAAVRPPTERRHVRRRGGTDWRREPAITAPVPAGPIAVVTAGPAGAGRRSLVAALLTGGTPLPQVPPGAFLALRYAGTPTASAYLPGRRQPVAYPLGPGSACRLERPPRRVELGLPEPLLRYVDLVDSPDTGSLSPAGARVVADAARQAGALLFVLAAGQRFNPVDHALLAQVAGAVPVFFALTCGERGSTRGPRRPTDGPLPGPGTVAGYRDALRGLPSELADAPWILVDQSGSAAGKVRRVLMDWASEESLRRGATPPQTSDDTRSVAVRPEADWPGWADRLSAGTRRARHALRERIDLELADIHLRCVRHLLAGGDQPDLPTFLDHELHALSLLATAEIEDVVRRLVDESVVTIFGQPPEAALRRRVVAAVGWGFVNHRIARDLDRVLLVEPDGRVRAVSGLGAVAGLPAFAGAPGPGPLPPAGVALSAAAFGRWAGRPIDTEAARSWLQRTVREVRMELFREVDRRYEAVRLSLTDVLAEAVKVGALRA
jgi:hypothetical protein